MNNINAFSAFRDDDRDTLRTYSIVPSLTAAYLDAIVPDWTGPMLQKSGDPKLWAAACKAVADKAEPRVVQNLLFLSLASSLANLGVSQVIPLVVVGHNLAFITFFLPGPNDDLPFH